MRTPIMALAFAAMAFPAGAQDVGIHVGPNGELTGSASAGGLHSEVGAAHGRTWAGPTRGLVHCTGNGRSRTTTIISHGGSSSSSSSASVSGNGVVSSSGSGSPGSVIYESGCGPSRGVSRPRAAAPHPVIHHKAVRHRRHSRR